MKRLGVSLLTCISIFAAPVFANNAVIQGKIYQVFTGQDDWYGTRFSLNEITSNTIDGVCDDSFVYTEPKVILLIPHGTGTATTNNGTTTTTSTQYVQPLTNGHDSKVAIFLAAYLAKKTVTMTVVSGKNGFCELIEGHIAD